MKITLLTIIPLFLVFSSCSKKISNFSGNYNNALLGSWEMKTVSWIAKDTTYTIEKAQPGIFIFSKDYYSIMWTPTQKQRVPFKNLSKPTKEEIISGFRSIVFNAGTYVFTDSTVTSTAYVAKVPGFEGGQQYYKYKIEDEILTIEMFDETYPDGTKPKWVGKYNTEFILKKTKK